MKKEKERHPLFDKSRIAYGFLKSMSAIITEEIIGEYLGYIFLAIDDYEDYIDQLKD